MRLWWVLLFCLEVCTLSIFCSVHLYGLLLEKQEETNNESNSSVPYTCADCFHSGKSKSFYSITSIPCTCVDCFYERRGITMDVRLLLHALVPIASAEMHRRWSVTEAIVPKQPHKCTVTYQILQNTLPCCVWKDIRYAHLAVRTPTGKRGYLMFAHAVVGTDLPPRYSLFLLFGYLVVWDV